MRAITTLYQPNRRECDKHPGGDVTSTSGTSSTPLQPGAPHLFRPGCCAITCDQWRQRQHLWSALYIIFQPSPHHLSSVICHLSSLSSATLHPHRHLSSVNVICHLSSASVTCDTLEVSAGTPVPLFSPGQQRDHKNSRVEANMHNKLDDWTVPCRCVRVASPPPVRALTSCSVRSMFYVHKFVSHAAPCSCHLCFMFHVPCFALFRAHVSANYISISFWCFSMFLILCFLMSCSCLTLSVMLIPYLLCFMFYKLYASMLMPVCHFMLKASYAQFLCFMFDSLISVS
jgi:hypothetical protein